MRQTVSASILAEVEEELEAARAAAARWKALAKRLRGEQEDLRLRLGMTRSMPVFYSVLRERKALRERVERLERVVWALLILDDEEKGERTTSHAAVDDVERAVASLVALTAPVADPAVAPGATTKETR